MKTLYVKGEKDGKMRRVEHQPMDAQRKQTPSGPDHWWMWLTQDDGKRVYTTVSRDKVIEVKE
jgi:hypothetical protein